MRSTSIKVAAAIAGCGLLGGVMFLSYRTMLVARQVRRHVAKPAPLPKPDLNAYIAQHGADKDPNVQDRVGEARLHVAYSQANESWKTPNDKAKKLAAFEKARQTFLTADREYKGTGVMGADFGGIKDEAAYQAAACLVAEGKNDQAKKGLLAFMKDRPLSPLCKACYRRLIRLNGGKTTSELDALMQKDTDAQGKNVRFELSVCGPKAIEALLPLIGKPKQDYRAIAKLCGTTDTGTTVEGMRKGLKALGLMSYGVQVNAADFAKLQAPDILLVSSHYVLITHVDRRHVTLFDPTTKQTTVEDLPAADSPDFLATVITFTLPDLASN